MADELRRGAETSRSESEFRIALDRYLEIITKLDGIDSPDIFLLGFGLDCYKSAIYLQVNFYMTCILDSFRTLRQYAINNSVQYFNA